MGRIVAILEVEGEGKYAVVEAAMISVREARRVGRGCGGALRLVKVGDIHAMQEASAYYVWGSS
jgi:hypothetical protein